jgi:tetratricopeptide (TPR) repeat protein
MYVALALIGLAALSADAPPASAPDGRHAVQIETYAALRTRLGRALEAKNYEDVLSAAKAMSLHPDFRGLDARHQMSVHYLIGLANIELDRPAAAAPSFILASEAPDATFDIWMSRLQAQSDLRDRDAAARSVVLMLGRFPDALDHLSDTYLAQMARSPELDRDLAFELRMALYRSGWDYEYASWTWVELVDDLITRDRAAEATSVFKRATTPGARVQLFALRRYDSVRPADADPDLEALFDRVLEREREAAGADDASIEALHDYAVSLLNRGRFEEALAVADRALSAPQPEAGTDAADSLTWTMDTRARALMALGRTDDAIEQMRVAAARAEGEGPNVSQTINLGWLYLRADRNAEAMSVAATVKEDQVSPYGRMQAVQVRACAAAAVGDPSADGAFAYLSEHWRDAPMAAFDALACRGDEAGMAALLLSMLEDPEHAISAVELAHVYLPQGHRTPFDLRVSAHTAGVLARPDVMAAMAQVGRSLTVPTVGPQF